ncbi:MAG: thioesterase [Candidatus Pelagibacter sp. TMED128]|nr:MAG: thioesterase [Candidatus Pelagibacter sp. TMED128]|tara:strand:+ start:284 stop:661 length:378 start_codon:yes stop_codon:yes gene_type:complete
MEEAKSEFAKHIGGLNTKKINDSSYEFYAEVKDINLNTSKIAHGGFICSIADTGMGNAAYKAAGNKRCVTISLDLKFISVAHLGQNLIGKVKIQRKTRTLVFATCEINNSEKIVATASGVWKILK